MPNLANYQLLAVFIFHKTGDKVVLTERKINCYLQLQARCGKENLIGSPNIG